MKIFKITYVFALICLLASCRGDLIDEIDKPPVGEDSKYPDWTEESHSNDVDPNYSVVFNDNEIHRFDIHVSDSNWTILQNYLLAAEGEVVQAWVPCTLNFDGKEWYNVGVKYKGGTNITNKKYSFKLDFDEFENIDTVLHDQRFYGFKQLNLANNSHDPSFIREKAAADLFREFGIVSPRTGFCVVYVSNGTDTIYHGVYTLIEEVDDTVLESQFGEKAGNLYKPDGPSASFEPGIFNPIDFEKETNIIEDDYSDIIAFFDVLNNNSRYLNHDQWKTDLEAIFDVDTFLKWLAANTAMKNWDSYGNKKRNFYLYNSSNKLTWIPWDNNESLGFTGDEAPVKISLVGVKAKWPLIKYLADDTEYYQTYKTYLAEFTSTYFTTQKMNIKYNSYYNTLKQYVLAETPEYSFLLNSNEFDTANEALKLHTQERVDAVNLFLQQ